MLVRITADFGADQLVNDGFCVIAFEPAVGGDGSAAGAVGAGVHHDNAVAGAQEKFRLANGSHAVVGLAVEEKNPVAVGFFGQNFPAAEKHSIRCPDVEIQASGTGDGERGVGFADQIRGQFAADGTEERGAGHPADHCGEERREKQ